MFPLKCPGIAGRALSQHSLSPPDQPVQPTAHPSAVPALCSLWEVAHVQRGKELRSALPLHVRESSSCRALHAKCRTWLLLHHSEHQSLQPRHYSGPWRSCSRVYPHPWPTGMATDRAKDSSTPLTAGLDVTSQELLTLYITQNKHQDVLEGAQYIEQNPQKTLESLSQFQHSFAVLLSGTSDTICAFVLKYHLCYLLAHLYILGDGICEALKHQIVLTRSTSSETLLNKGLGKT